MAKRLPENVTVLDVQNYRYQRAVTLHRAGRLPEAAGILKKLIADGSNRTHI